MKYSSWLLTLLLTVAMINYPNPFNPKGGQIATFECSSEASVLSTIYLYDMSARLLWKKAFNISAGAINRTTWNGYSDFNELAGNGVYLYRLIDNNSNKLLAKGKVWVINR